MQDCKGVLLTPMCSGKLPRAADGSPPTHATFYRRTLDSKLGHTIPKLQQIPYVTTLMPNSTAAHSFHSSNSDNPAQFPSDPAHFFNSKETHIFSPSAASIFTTRTRHRHNFQATSTEYAIPTFTKKITQQFNVNRFKWRYTVSHGVKRIRDQYDFVVIFYNTTEQHKASTWLFPYPLLEWDKTSEKMVFSLNSERIFIFEFGIGP
uniref:Uncharacterized protein n=1 Tax=Solanum tuberosum TaxID=4113 RepID=M1B3F5_SOLTU